MTLKDISKFPELAVTVEGLIDRYGLTAVVDTVCEVCYDKSEHIRTMYGDTELAKDWNRAGYSLVNPKPKFASKFPS